MSTLRRSVPAFLDVLKLRASPVATDVIDVIDIIRAIDSPNEALVDSQHHADAQQRRGQTIEKNAGCERFDAAQDQHDALLTPTTDDRWPRPAS
ncbi:MAG: hypothetical protein ACREU6_00830 [Steroidobacteraceae bacterium]